MLGLQEQLREESRRSTELALTDELTGVLNRRAVLGRLEEVLGNSERLTRL
jgi:PleD family two-component response regulator